MVGRSSVRSVVFPLSLAVFFSACTVGPDFRKPKTDIPPDWTEKHEHATSRDRISLAEWWRSFDDPVLDRLVDDAIGNNLSLAIAQQRIIMARAERENAVAGWYPQINLSATKQSRGYSGTMQWPGLPQIAYRYWDTTFDSSWELDIFGGTRRMVEAANASADALVEGRRAILVSLISELASQYAVLRASQLRLEIVRKNEVTAQHIVDLVSKEVGQGIRSTLDLSQARAELETIKATEPPLHAMIAMAAHAIGVLIGKPPGGTLEAELLQPTPVLPVPPALPVLLPAQVIADRPDLRRVERDYAMALAQVGVAKAQLYPRFMIPIVVQPMSSTLHQLFSAASMTWMMGVGIAQPLFDGGRRHARLTAAQAEAEAARITYEESVLIALREVEDALVNFSTAQERDKNLLEAQAQSQKALAQSRTLYEHGLTGYMRVLDAQRSALAAEDAVAISKLDRIRNTIQLYKALGGGWQNVTFNDPKIETRLLQRTGLPLGMDNPVKEEKARN
ncbi:Type I secretion outer membrane protein [Granulibacter bethesdensis]|uniref:Type I secretion outer membrane protein n=1 Tax=Granulibacter bethesdensis (strain ATCC BAA-1260 / CGDNIH1) TaxID=391165 RepID=Q0BQ74_GRABC|nr:Type I secretion outer membrane protein [Granulibacter bethesdensis CGDNIH1]AHJ68009.1 Type I secretion outer membrane protein [Granulibacter bethesdensis]APH52900.1 Type I secretion outer membrane protein [Granulibacter bethesdensis]APH65588.1 Type I secretion outer membrane protein [Granulibacter bethesdensis]